MKMTLRTRVKKRAVTKPKAVVDPIARIKSQQIIKQLLRNARERRAYTIRSVGPDHPYAVDQQKNINRLEARLREF